MTDYIIVIPARYKSTRFPGKPLVSILGKSMLQRTYEQCVKAVSADKVLVATEDERIVEHCREHNMNVILTSDDCLTGTDRVAEVARSVNAQVFINVQGDEPLFNPEDIKKVIALVEQYPGEVINGYCPIETADQYNSVSVPKVVFSQSGQLMYMSRSPIPGNKKNAFVKAWRQVCIYAFPKASLEAFSGQLEKTPLEEIEDIEILRFVELGIPVRMVELSTESVAVDHAEDLAAVEKIIMQHAQ